MAKNEFNKYKLLREEYRNIISQITKYIREYHDKETISDLRNVNDPLLQSFRKQERTLHREINAYEQLYLKRFLNNLDKKTKLNMREHEEIIEQS